jgi:hypothetical protein
MAAAGQAAAAKLGERLAEMALRTVRQGNARSEQEQMSWFARSWRKSFDLVPLARYILDSSGGEPAP